MILQTPDNAPRRESVWPEQYQRTFGGKPKEGGNKKREGLDRLSPKISLIYICLDESLSGIPQINEFGVLCDPIVEIDLLPTVNY